MRAVKLGQRPSFKSQLLIGAAGLAAAATSTAAYADGAVTPPADPPKWKPFVQLGAGGDNQSGIGSVNFFAPLKQDLDSMLFLRVGLQTRFQDDNLENLNIGFRKKSGDNSWIFGGYVGFDREQTKLDNDYTQFSAGLEAMSVDWDAHINGYLAQHKVDAIPGSFRLDIHGTFIGIEQQQEAAFSGFDGEVGFRILHGGDTDVRLYAGGFSFDVNNKIKFPTKTMSGPKGGIEIDLYDLDFLGPQSRFQATGEMRHDDLRGTTEFFGAQLRIPLGDRSGDGSQTLDELDRRMVDDIKKKDGVQTSAQFNKSEPVIIYGHGITSQPTNTLFYVDNTAGDGSLDDPTTLPDATTRPGPNQFIVLTDKDGPLVHSGGATVESGETLVEGGHTFNVVGVSSGEVFSHTFAPGTGPITVNNPGGTVLNLGSNTAIYGFNIIGPFTNGIYAHNVNNVVIDHIGIDGGGAGTNGILLNQDTAGDGMVTIVDSSVGGVTNNAIDVETNATGGNLNFDLYVDNSTLDGGNHAIYQNGNATGGANVDSYAHIHDSTLSSGGTNVGQNASAGPGSSVVETVFIDPTTLTGGYYGVQVFGHANGGNVTQNVILEDVTISGTKYSGVGVYGDAHSGGTLTQNVTMTNVSITGSYSPIIFDAIADSAGTAAQHLTMTHVQASGGQYNNIMITGEAGYGSTVTQTASMDDVTSSNSSNGFGLVLDGSSFGGTVTQHVDVTDSEFNYNHDGGVSVTGIVGSYTTGGEGATTYSGLLAQYVTIDNSTIRNNGVGGEGVYTGGSVRASLFATGGASGLQDIAITNSDLSDNGFGAYFGAYATNLGSAQQNVVLDTDDLTGAGSGPAAYFGAEGTTGGFAAQAIGIYYSDLSHSAGGALVVLARANQGGNVEQTLNAYYDDFSHSGASNVVLGAYSDGYSPAPNAEGYYYYSHAAQTVVIAYSDLSHAGQDGIDIYSSATNFSEVNQTTVLYTDDLSRNGRDGVHVNAYGGPAASDYSDVYAYTSDLSHNGRDGFNAYSLDVNADYGFGNYLIQHLNVVGSDATYNGRTGFVDIAEADGMYSFNDQYVVLANSHFDHEGLDGAAILGTQVYGYLSFGASIQNVTIQNSTFDNNTRDGLYATLGSYEIQGRGEQHFTVNNASFDNNGRDGIYMSNTAAGGDYRNELGCGYAQGLYGGCAFVRQTFIGSGVEATYNGRNGVSIINNANDYGAIYQKGGRPLYPSFYLLDSNLSHNAGDGLHLENTATNDSYVYQYVLALDSHFDDNGGFGIQSTNTVGANSYLIQKIVVYGTGGEGGSSVSGNTLGGIKVDTMASGAIFDSTKVGVYYSNVVGNGGDGISATQLSDNTGFAVQTVNVAGNAIVGNAGYGVYAYNGSSYDFIASQSVTSAGNYIAGNDKVGMLAIAADSPFSGEGGSYYTFLAQQSLDSSYDTFAGNGLGSLGQVAIIQATYIAYQFTTVDHDSFSGGSSGGLGGPFGDGLYVELATGSLYAYAGRTITNNTAMNVGTNGIDVVDYSVGYLLDNTVIDHNTTTGSGHAGISVSAFAAEGGVVYQQLSVGFDVAENNRFGVMINANANYGQVAQYITADHLHANSNTKDGLDLSAIATGQYASAGQSADVMYGKFNNNGGTGISLDSSAYFYGVSQQVVTLSNTSASSNKTGVSATAYSAFAASANQQLNVSDGAFSNNLKNGIDMQGSSAFGGFTAQGLLVMGGEGGTRINHNGGSGVSVDGSAVYGGNVEQNIGIYNTTMTSNGRDGLTTSASAVGYAYPTPFGYPLYSHVTQNLIAGYDDFNGNTRDGIHIENTAGLYAELNHFAYIYGSQLNGNGKNGLYETSQNISPNNPFPALTQLYSNVYVYRSEASHNARDGISINSVTAYPSYLIQKVTVNGTTADSNGRNGFTDNASAVGYFSLNQQTITLANSHFDKNGADGAYFSVYQNYGPYSFGAAIQNISISGSSFDKNGKDGLGASAVATGLQGRAEQNILVSGSEFDGNHRDGLHLDRYAGGGTYQNDLDCTEVQGLGGGCAFVRQRVQLLYSDVSHNTRDGIYIGTVVNDYGAVYTSSGRPHNTTLLVYGSTIDSNGRDGVDLKNTVTNNSYLYQFAYFGGGTTISKNGRDGVRSSSYVAGDSTMLQRIDAYSYAAPPVTFKGNGRGGIDVSTTAVDGGFAYSHVQAQGVTFNGEYTDGIALTNISDGTGTSVGALNAYFNTFKGNQIGIALTSNGTGAYQYAYIGYNLFKSNGTAIRGRAKNGGFQYVDLHYGNSIGASNTVAYSFKADGASTQVINY